MTQLQQRHSSCLLIYNSTRTTILLAQHADTWSLPTIQLDDTFWLADVFQLAKPLQRLLGEDHLCSVVRCIEYASQDEQYTYMFLMECADIESITQASNLKWLALTELTQVAWSQDNITELIITHAQEDEFKLLSEQRSPWELRSWLPQAKTWIHEELNKLGYQINSIEQIKWWSISCILRVQTTTETLYFKASQFAYSNRPPGAKPILFTNEVALTHELCQLIPQHVADVLVSDVDRGWMITKNFGEPLDTHTNWSYLLQAVETMSSVHITLSNHITQLTIAGCQDRSLETLIISFEDLCQDAQTLKLSENEKQRLLDCKPVLQKCITQLATYNIPHTLLHGDLHMGNMAIKNNQVIIYDWSDGCVAHPFLDLIALHVDESKYPDITDPNATLRTAYLAGWTAYETMVRLTDALAIAHVLTALHQAISYQHILANSATVYRGIWADIEARWLREMFKRLDDWQQ